MLDDFFIRALLAGLGLAAVTGPLGSFVVWRRMAYFGDSTAHAAILGVALSLAFGMSIYIGTVGVALAMALLVSSLSSRGQSMDTILGVLAHSALAIGLVAISFVPSARADLSSYLFGDILAVGRGDLALIWTGGALVLGTLIWRWQRLVTSTLNDELAMAAGIDPRVERLVLSVALAVVVALAIRVVGSLLISALLIVPAAAARGLAPTPERMAASATAIAAASVAGGLWASLRLDTPAGPSIVAAAAVFFVLSQVFRRF
ncbi:metal ABC transporter permease [Paracoccus sp. R12_1]|uniref:metal ABC transporter permease n=1 Tax=unclassified Paracoccus (in: a-proteobacteria) TaxID=2688777 RepID=UPI001ADB530A|nr:MULTISPECIES: metal ABC transporter permease [unclassified Paracoccus (in: a-proteobacteria)]MBO9455042.1 metal ABC transporter permease [Paracoccus sp. R12_2]MBO9485270.1 metal ABC transporter permease [Paracoccus sp. R12_1]